MTSQPSVLVVIHARGGSVRVPLKNIADLGGKPLIAWSVEAACAAKTVNRVIVSTDHDGIAEAARAYGAEVPFKRPPELSEDVASELVTQNAALFHEDQTGAPLDIVVTIQPTTPFIQARDVDGCVSTLWNNDNLDSVFTICAVHQRPEWMFSADENNVLTPLNTTPIQGNQGVTQLLPALYHPNGGIYATRRETLFRDNRIIAKRTGGWEMSPLRSVDIDEPIDLIIARAVLDHLDE